MEESDTEEILTKLKSSLPICRVCLDISMEYIEFEATLCVVNGREITFSEGFHELIAPHDKDLTHQNMTTNFCATCGKDLLNAYLFLKRIEHANYALNKLKMYTEENSKFLAKEEDHDGNKNMILNLKSESCKKNDEIYRKDAKNTGSNNSSTFDELVKIENLVQEDCEFEYETVFDDNDMSMEKEELLSEEAAETHILTKAMDGVETESNRRNIESPSWVSKECLFLCEREEVSEENEKLHMLEFHESFNLDDHNEHMEKKDFSCSICSCAFLTKRSLNFHKRHIHKNSESTYSKLTEYKKCQYCRRMIRKSNMESHLVTHSIEIDKIYNCTLCEETFTTKIGLKQHSYTHTKDQNQYACHICGKICLRPFTLRNHIQSKHMSERRKHQCEDCGLFFQFPSLLKEHRRKHNMNNRFKCSHCDRTFVRKPQLDIHMRYHLNDFPYKCDQCDKCYVSKSNLTDHIRSKHTKTTYDCDRCKQKFKSQTGLRKHKFAHDGYPYNCPMCSVGQTSRSGMKQHMMGVHKDALTEEEFDIIFPIIIPKTGYRRPKHMFESTINN